MLFLERGPHHRATTQRDWLGDVSDPDAAEARGYWPEPLHAVVDGRGSTCSARSASGSAARRCSTRRCSSGPSATTSTRCPAARIRPAAGRSATTRFRPYFEAAEELSRSAAIPTRCAEVRRPRCGAAGALARRGRGVEALRRKGLHPYRKHVGVRYLPGCAECFGRMCPRRCKMDGRSAGVEPALATGRAALIDGCEVLALRGTRRTDQPGRGDARRRDGCASRRASCCSPPAALDSPRLLLASASEDWPRGCANESGLVGRNLMFHLNERFAALAAPPDRSGGPVGAISLRDFYREGHAPRPCSVDGTARRLRQHPPLLRHKFEPRSRRAPGCCGRCCACRQWRRGGLGRAQVFVGMLEDLPRAGNRVVFDSGRPAADRVRVRGHAGAAPAAARAFRALIRPRFGGSRTFFLSREPELNIAHCCGTLRFGDDPATSVLDPCCRAHGLDNLYVADASFMPTSNGVNPSLTIAANALRVADQMAAALRDARSRAAANG